MLIKAVLHVYCFISILQMEKLRLNGEGLAPDVHTVEILE